MGYESKVFIVKRTELPGRNGFEPMVFAEEIATMDLSKMGGIDFSPEFYKAFKTEIDYTLFLPNIDNDGNEIMEEQNRDRYDEHMKSATLEDLLDALKKCERREHYRRVPPLIALIKQFIKDKDEWGDSLEAVHYGY